MGNSKSKGVKYENLMESDEQYFKKVERRNRVKTHDMSIPQNNNPKEGKGRSSRRSLKNRKQQQQKQKQQNSNNAGTKTNGNGHQSSTANAIAAQSPLSPLQQQQEQQEMMLTKDVHATTNNSVGVRDRSALLNQAAEQQSEQRPISWNMGSPSSSHNPASANTGTGTLGIAALPPNTNAVNGIGVGVVALNLNSHSFASTLTSPGPSPDKTIRTLPPSKSNLSLGGSHNGNSNSIALLPTPRGSSKLHEHGPAGNARRKKKAQEANARFEEAINAGGCLVHREITRGGKVSSVAWCPLRGSTVAAIGTDDGFVSIVDAAVDDNDPRFVLREFPREGKVRSLSWSSDGRLLAMGGDDCIAAVVDVKTMQIMTELEREDRVYAVQFSPDDELLAIGGFDGMVAVALVMTKTKQFELLTEIPRQGLVLSLGWSPDSSLLAACGSDKQLTVFDAGDDWDIVSELQRPASIHCVRWSPDGRHILLGGQDGSVVVVDVEARSIVREIQRETQQQKLLQHGGGSVAACRINAVCWSGDGSFLCIGSSDRVASIYETKSYVLLHEIRRGGDVVCVDWQLGGSGYLAIGGDDRKVGIIKTGGGSITNMDDNGVANMAVASSLNHSGTDAAIDNVNQKDDEQQVFGRRPQSSSASNATTANNREVISVVPQISDESFAADWAKSKQEFANNNNDDGLIPQVTVSSEIEQQSSLQSQQASTSINVVAVSNDVYYMASGGSDGSVLVYGTDNWEVVMELEFPGPIRCLCWSKAGEYLVVGIEDDDIVYVAQVGDPDWEIVEELRIDSSATCVGWSVADQRLAVGASDGSLTVIDTTQYPATEWTVTTSANDSAGESEASVYTLDWSANGKYLAVGGAGATCNVYDAKRIVARNELEVQASITRDSAVHTVSFGAGGNFLAIGGADYKLAVYRAKGDWALCQELKFDGWVLSASFCFDGRYLAAGAGNRKRPYTVVDTISWDSVAVSEEHFADTLLANSSEEATSLDWSNDGKWLVIGSSTGDVRVVDVDTLEVVYLIERGTSSFVDEEGEEEEEDRVTVDAAEDYHHDHQHESDVVGDEDELDDDDDVSAVSDHGEESMPAYHTNGFSDGHSRNPMPVNSYVHEEHRAMHHYDGTASEISMNDANSILEDLASAATTPMRVPSAKKLNQSSGNDGIIQRWTQRNESRAFLEICDDFLAPYEYDDPPQILRVFVASILMLQWHVKWLDSHAMIVDVLSLQNDGGPLDVLCLLLQRATDIMEEVIEKKSQTIYQWWSSSSKFNLTERDIKSLITWNSWWEQVDADASVVDYNLLSRVDNETSAVKGSAYLAEEDREEANYGYDQSEHVHLPTVGRRVEGSPMTARNTKMTPSPRSSWQKKKPSSGREW